KGKGWEAYAQILDFLHRSHIRYALTHRLRIVFDSLVKQFWATAVVHTHETGPSQIVANIDGYPTDGSLTFYKAKLSPQWRFLIHTLIHCMSSKSGGWNQFPSSIASVLICMSTGRTYNFSSQIIFQYEVELGWTPYASFGIHVGGSCWWDGADAVAVGAAAAHNILPPIVPPTHSSFSIPGPSSPLQPTPVREPSPVREPTPVRDPSPVREPTPLKEPTPIREPTPRPVREPTPDSPRPPSPPLRSEEVGPTASTRPPSPTGQSSFHEDISEGGGDFVSLPKSNEAPLTPAAIAAAGAEDSAALTALSIKLDRCIKRVTSLENELGITKKVLGGAFLKLVTRVKRLEGLLQQRKRRLVLSDSKGEDATPTEQDIDLEALHTLASTSLGGDSTDKAAGHDVAEVPADATMPFHSTSTTRRRLKKSFTSSTSAHVPDNIPASAGIPAVATTIPAGSSMDAAVHAAAAPSSSIPAVDKGKAPMVDDSLPADLLSEQERVLKNLHDYQLGEDLAKKLHVEQEAEFARQQEELAQKAQAERVELLAKIATNPALSKQLLGDDVTKDNMNERLGMLLLHKRRELAEQSRVKPMTKTQQRDYMRDFVKNNSASVYNQGWTMKKVKALSIAQLKHEFEYIQRHLERSNLLNFRHFTFRPKPTLDAPSAKRANQGVPQVPAASSQVPASVPDAPSFAADVSVSAATTPEVPTAESRPADTPTASVHVSVEPSVAASTPSSSHKRRKHIAKKWVTPIVDRADDALIKFDSDSGSDDDPLPYAPYASWEMVPSPLDSVHAYYDMAGHTKHFTSLRKLLYMVERTDLQKLLGTVDNLYQREDPDTFALLLWVDLHVLFQSLDDEDAHDFWRNQDSWRIRSWRLYPPTLELMLKHGLEVPKLLVGGDLTMAEELSWLVQEQMALGKDKSNPLTVGSLLKTIWSSIHHLLTNEVLTSPEQMASGKDVSNSFMAVMVCQKPLGHFSSPMIHVPRAELVINPPGCCCFMILLSLVFLLVFPAGLLIPAECHLHGPQEPSTYFQPKGVKYAPKEVKPRLVLAMAMTIQSRVKQMILAAQSEKALGTRLDLSTAYHPQKDGQSERIIQNLKDMLRVCVINFSGSWDVHIPLAELSYNNNYYSSIRHAPFEDLYGRKYRSPVLWAEIKEGSLIGPELVLETTDKVVLIKEKLKAARDRQKSYMDKRRKPLEFEVGDRVLLKVSPWKGVEHFGKK
nr:putative reverse transcriptase domain-containing protein [Tanacetum cinerariifolium]